MGRLRLLSGLAFQSTLPLRGATDSSWLEGREFHISIHAPLTGSDPGKLQLLNRAGNFNPRSPYGERPTSNVSSQRVTDFNPRSPYGERPGIYIRAEELQYFNPRSPYGERPTKLDLSGNWLEFQSTLPLRGATRSSQQQRIFNPISIHAPLTGSDSSYRTSFSWTAYFNPRSPYGSDVWTSQAAGQSCYFNPRSPYGERQQIVCQQCQQAQFQSTLPLRGAILSTPILVKAVGFQSTLPLRGAKQDCTKFYLGFCLSSTIL